MKKPLDSTRWCFNKRTPPPGVDPVEWLDKREKNFSEFWAERFHQGTPLTSAELDYILSYVELETSLSVVGDAARWGLLSDNLCESVISNKSVDHANKVEWARGEARLSLLASQLRRSVVSEIRIEVLDKILGQSRIWPFLRVLESLSERELEYCEMKMASRDVLTKYEREQARQAIRKQKKKRIKTSGDNAFKAQK